MNWLDLKGGWSDFLVSLPENLGMSGLFQAPSVSEETGGGGRGPTLQRNLLVPNAALFPAGSDEAEPRGHKTFLAPPPAANVPEPWLSYSPSLNPYTLFLYRDPLGSLVP